MARDNFTKQVIDTLKARVSLRCSNPACRVPTSGPTSDAEKINIIGIAAHICAASSGGPRYDSAMTTDQRKSIRNGIWLCSNCSIDIDKDVDFYTVSLLKKWKENAETTARSELGKRLPSDNDAINMTTTALTGHTKGFIAGAISNTHQASSNALESLDSRFSVKTAYIDDKTTIGIYAKENVSITMKFNGDSVKEFIEKHRQLIENGEDVEMKSNSITIDDSKLFDEIFNKNESILKISSKKMDATQKLWLIQKDTNIMEAFDDLQGKISLGTKSFTFEGSSCNGLFNFGYQKSLDKENIKADIKMSINLEQWEGIDLRALPYLEKILSLFEKMSQGWEVFLSLEVNGKRILSNAGMDVSSWEYVLEATNHLTYINRCRIISDAFDFSINYTSDVSYTTENHKRLANVVQIIEGKQSYSHPHITGNAITDMIVDEECQNVKGIAKMTVPSSITISEQEEDLEIFGIKYKLPRKVISLDLVLPNIHGKIHELKSGDIVKVEWIPQKDCKLIINYDC